MAKKHTDKELQNMSVEALQSLKNNLLPQKERPDYDTHTGGGRDGGMCCDASLGCFVDCATHGCTDAIEYPDIYLSIVSGTDFQTVSYPFQEDFLNANLKDVLNASFTDLSGVPTSWPDFASLSIYYSTNGENDELIVMYVFGGEWIASDTLGVFGEGNGFKIPPGSSFWFTGLSAPGIINWTLPSV